jgi:peptidoglycan hydrolase-like protein with peptidoglycan-binding domain
MQAQIAALQAQIAALQAAMSGGASVTFTRDLTIGSTGGDVVALQTWLISKGYSIPAGATGYFGVQTRAAVSAFQAANGISPTAGYFGPITRARVNAMAGTGGSTGGNTGGTTGGLQGGAGQLKNIETLGDVESDLQEGDGNTRVLGFEAEAKDSDVAVQRVDVKFTIANSGGSASLSKYVDSVSLYQGDKKLASMDASDGDKDGRVWTFRFSDLNGVVKEGDTENFYVVVTPVSSVGADEAGDTVTAQFLTDGIRAIDAQGVSETYTPSTNTAESFTVSTATDGRLTISEASDNPKATTVKADTSDTTEDVTLLSFNLKAKEQNVTVNNLPIGITSNAANLNDYVQTVKLMKGNDVLKSKSITSTGTFQEVVFENLDEQIDQDDSENYTVVATIRKIDSAGSTFGSGDYLFATTSAPGQNNTWDVEDEDGNTITPTGSLTGNNISFQATGITVTKVDASYTKTVGQNAGEGDKTQYSIKFKVTAGDDDLYIGRAITRLTSPATTPTGNASGVNWATTTSSTASTTAASPATNLAADDTNNADVAGYFKVPSGTSRNFTLNVTLTAAGPTGTATGYTGVQLVGINYSTTTTIGAVYYTSGLDTFKTADVLMTTH